MIQAFVHIEIPVDTLQYLRQTFRVRLSSAFCTRSPNHNIYRAFRPGVHHFDRCQHFIRHDGTHRRRPWRSRSRPRNQAYGRGSLIAIDTLPCTIISAILLALNIFETVSKIILEIVLCHIFF